MAFPSREQKHPKNLVRCYEPWSCDFQSVHTEHPKALRSHDALQISGLALGFIDVIFSVLPFILRHTAREKDDLRFCVSPKYCDPCWSGWSKIHAGCRLSDLFPEMNHTSEALTSLKLVRRIQAINILSLHYRVQVGRVKRIALCQQSSW